VNFERFSYVLVRQLTIAFVQLVYFIQHMYARGSVSWLSNYMYNQGCE
jgi:hypothetical protein